MNLIPDGDTHSLCVSLKSSNGRSDHFKSSLIRAVRQAIDPPDALRAVRIVITGDWNKTQLYYNSKMYNIYTLDYAYIVKFFWKLWRKLSHQFDTTYVKVYYNFIKEDDHKPTRHSWTYMNICIGDTPARLSNASYGMLGRGTQAYQFAFQGDKKQIMTWMRHWCKIDSEAARITVRVFGYYGNMRCLPYSEHFEYEQV